MARLISKSASPDSIIADYRVTAVNVATKKGKWLEIWDNRKSFRIVELIDFAEKQIADLHRGLPAMKAAVKTVDVKSDNRIGGVSDEYWNDVGRPYYDPVLAVIFPGGIAAYTDGADEEQPNRMELLAELLVQVKHPLESPEKTKVWADQIRSMAEEYRALVAVLDNAEQKLSLYVRVRASLAKVAQMELANLKRTYKAEGFSETEIHTVIPATSKPTPSKPPAPENPPAEA